MRRRERCEECADVVVPCSIARNLFCGFVDLGSIVLKFAGKGEPSDEKGFFFGIISISMYNGTNMEMKYSERKILVLRTRFL